MRSKKIKKITFLFFTCFLISKLSLGYSYEDYTLYIQAKKDYEKKDYAKAENEFLSLKRRFPYSKVQQEKLLDFYTGLSKYHLGKTEEARFLLMQNVLTQYDDERNFILSKIYLKRGEKKAALLYLDRLLSPQYTYTHELLEKEIQKNLIPLDSYYKYYFQAKFSKNFSNISFLKTSDILEIIQYLSSKGEEKESQTLVLAFLMDRSGMEGDFFPFYETLLESFFRTKDYDKVLQYADLFVTIDPNTKDNTDFYTLQKARALFRKKDYLRSIFYYQEIKDPRYTDEASLELASIEYSLNHYNKVIDLLSKKTSKTTQDWSLLGNSYYATGQEEKFLFVAKKLQEKDPSAYENILYQFLITHPNVPIESLHSLFFVNILVESYLKNLYDFDLKSWDYSNSLEYKKLIGLKDVNDLDIVQAEIKNTQFYNISTLENSYFISQFYEMLGYYHLAFQNSSKHIADFGRFKNLIHFLFPRYYQDLIQKYSFEYSIPEEMLYTLILCASQWDTKYEKKDSIGLFALPYSSTSKPFDLKNPEVSIRIACKKLKNLQKKYPKDLQCMLAFLYGEEYVKEIPFEENGDIFLSKVADLDTKERLQNLMLYYSFYKKLYYF